MRRRSAGRSGPGPPGRAPARSRAVSGVGTGALGDGTAGGSGTSLPEPSTGTSRRCRWPSAGSAPPACTIAAAPTWRQELEVVDLRGREASRSRSAKATCAPITSPRHQIGTAATAPCCAGCPGGRWPVRRVAVARQHHRAPPRQHLPGDALVAREGAAEAAGRAALGHLAVGLPVGAHERHAAGLDVEAPGPPARAASAAAAPSAGRCRSSRRQRSARPRSRRASRTGATRAAASAPCAAPPT